MSGGYGLNGQVLTLAGTSATPLVASAANARTLCKGFTIKVRSSTAGVYVGGANVTAAGANGYSLATGAALSSLNLLNQLEIALWDLSKIYVAGANGDVIEILSEL